jgi:hypothetical protein
VKIAEKAFFPLDKRLGLGESLFSAEMERDMVWLSGLLPSYEYAAQVYERIGKQMVSTTSLWEQVQQHGPRLKDYVEAQQARVSPERVVLPGHDLDLRKGVSLDGGMVNIRGEGWKEIKVGTAFDVELRLERDATTRELVEQPHALNMTYTAVLGSVEEFAPALWHLAVEHQLPQAFTSSVTADGAEWIWNLAADYFPDSTQIVDWFHACQHLADAASALFPNDPDKARQWYDRRRDDLYQGQIHHITLRLEQAGLSDHARYFYHHQRRMQYQAFHEDGYPIGSGTVESGVKQFKARLSGPGMRWSRPAAQHMLVIRAAIMGNSFDALWDAA